MTTNDPRAQLPSVSASSEIAPQTLERLSKDTRFSNSPHSPGKRLVGIVVDEDRFRYLHEAIDWFKSLLRPEVLIQPEAHPIAPPAMGMPSEATMEEISQKLAAFFQPHFDALKERAESAERQLAEAVAKERASVFEHCAKLIEEWYVPESVGMAADIRAAAIRGSSEGGKHE